MLRYFLFVLQRSPFIKTTWKATFIWFSRRQGSQTCIQNLFGVSSPLKAVSRKTRQLIGPEMEFLKLWSPRCEKLLFYYVSDTRKGKITAKFKSFKLVHIEDTKGFMSPENLEPFEKRASDYKFLNNHLVGLPPLDSSISSGQTALIVFISWSIKESKLCLLLFT